MHSDVFQFIETNLNKHYNRNITKNVIFLDINDFIEYLTNNNEVIKELVSINDLIIKANKSDDDALNELEKLEKDAIFELEAFGRYYKDGYN